MKKSSNEWLVLTVKAAWLMLAVLVVSGCKEKVEGCLDIEARNFDFSADRPCPDDCCEYPQMIFDIAFRWDTLTFRYNEPYNLTDDKVMKFLKSKFYISDINLTGESGSFTVADRIDLDVNDGSTDPVTFVDDFTLMSRDFLSFSYEIGEIQSLGTFDTLRFTVGLSEVANQIEPTSAPAGHPLAIQPDSMWSVENNYVFNKLVVIPDTLVDPPDTPDTLAYDVVGDANRVKIALPFAVNIETGRDLTIPLEIDYKKWLEGVDFESAPTLVIEKFIQNTQQAFSIDE